MNWFAWAILSAVFAGATAILAKVGVEGVSSNLATAIRTSVVLVMSWLVVWITKTGGGMESLSKRTWIFLTLSGLATGASWLCYFKAMQLGNASQVAPIDKLSVVLVVIFAAIFLGEAVTWRMGAGLAMMVGGMLLLAKG